MNFPKNTIRLFKVIIARRQAHVTTTKSFSSFVIPPKVSRCTLFAGSPYPVDTPINIRHTYTVSTTHPFILTHPQTVDGETSNRGRVICITSGKGGVGKTTCAASFAFGLALKGHKTCVIDFDIGLRNLDIHLGMERRVIFDLVNVILGECTVNQALIKDKRINNLHMLAASQTRDKDSLTVHGVEKVLANLCNVFEYVVLDSPAGIESGAKHAMYFADDAIIVTNPELSSCRDADKMVGFISSKSRRAELGKLVRPVTQTLLIARYDPVRAEAEETLSVVDIEELLGLPIIGLIPETKDVLTCTNMGIPVITMGAGNPTAGAFLDMVDRYLGEKKELRFVTPDRVSLFKRIFG